MHSIRRGYDPREFALVAFGGAGPLHACEIAAELEIPTILAAARARASPRRWACWPPT